MAELRAARDAASADMVELRVDGVTDLDVAGALAGRAKPVIFTCRAAWEGGRFDGNEEERLRHPRRGDRLGAEYVDVEWRADRRRSAGATRDAIVVLSHHDFSGTPGRSGRPHRAPCERASRTFSRLPSTAHRLSDAVRLRDAIALDMPHVAIAMGPRRALSRACARGCSDRCGPTAGTAAPGQTRRRGTDRPLSRRPAVGRHRVSTRSRRAAGALGLAGHAQRGVRRARARCRLRAARDRRRRRVAAGAARRSASRARASPRRSRPDVHARVPSAMSCATRTGSVNTLRRAATAWDGRNFDVAGFLAPFDAARGDLRGARRVVLGAGGAARTAAWALQSRGRARRGRRPSRRRAEALAGRARRRRVSVATGARLGSARQHHARGHVARRRRDRRSTPTPCAARIVYDLIYNPRGHRAAASGARRRAPRRSAASRCWSGRRACSSSGGPGSAAPRDVMTDAAARVRATHAGTRMKQTTFEEFADLAARGTFVPVCREIMADLLTPVSAFLKIAEHSDYAFLLESVEGGEQVGRYSFLGKDPFLIVRGRDGRDVARRGRRPHRARRSRSSTCSATLMAEFTRAVRAGPAALHGRRGRLLRLRRGRVVRAGRALAKPPADRDQATLHGVRHHPRVRPRASIASSPSPTRACEPGADLASALRFRVREDRVPRARTRAQRCRSDARARRRAARGARRIRRARRSRRRVRQIQEDIAAGEIYQAVLSQRFDATTDARAVRRVSRAAPHQPVALHVLHPHRAARRSSAPRPRCSCASRAATSRHTRLPARGGAARRRPRTRRWPRSCGQREGAGRARDARGPGPQRSSAAWPRSAACVCRSTWTVERYSHVMHLVSRVEGRAGRRGAIGSMRSWRRSRPAR